MDKFAVLFALFLFGCTTQPNPDSNLSILYGIPLSVEQTMITMGECCEGCLCHGTDIYRVNIRTSKHLYGRRTPREFETQALSGFLHFNGAPTNSKDHLFVIHYSESPQFDLPKLVVVEADPMSDGKYCTWNHLADYVGGEAPFFDYGAMDRFRGADDRQPHCYSKREILEILSDI